MKVTIEIPKEFEKHFENDRFEDSLKRIITDVTDEIESDFSISGKYEIELCEMLIEAFKEAAVIDEPWLSENPYFVKRWLETR